MFESPDNTPVFTEPTFLGEVDSGAQLIAVGAKVIVVQPTKPPMYVTPTGLVPIFDGNPREEGSGNG